MRPKPLMPTRAAMLRPPVSLERRSHPSCDSPECVDLALSDQTGEGASQLPRVVGQPVGPGDRRLDPLDCELTPGKAVGVAEDDVDLEPVRPEGLDVGGQVEPGRFGDLLAEVADEHLP